MTDEMPFSAKTRDITAPLNPAPTIQTLFIDTSITPQDLGRQLAFEMGAKYVPLPRGKSNQVVAAAKQLFV